MNKDINRIKVVLADKKRTNKWLAEQLGRDPATVSKWCTNSCQPTLETLMKIASLLEVSLNDLVRFEASPDIEKKKKRWQRKLMYVPCFGTSQSILYLQTDVKYIANNE